MKNANHIDDSPKGLRHFAITMAGIFTVLAFFMFRHGRTTICMISIIVAVFFLLALLKTRILRLPQKLWMGLAFLMGKVMTRVLMTLIFFVLVTPVALCAKLFRQDFLRPKNESKARPGSYWIPSAITRDNKEDYLRQF